MEISNEAIPADDILDLYMAVPKETQIAISNIISSQGNFISVAFAGTKPDGTPMVHIDWRANPQLAILLLTAYADVGRKKFGDTWLNALIQNLIQQNQHE